MTEKEVIDKYPNIFADTSKPMEESCMYWGLEVPDTWLPIIDELCDTINNSKYSRSTIVAGSHKEIYFPQVVAEQVKEKFNTLRFYYRLEYDQEDIPTEVMWEHHKYIDGMIAYAENRICRMEKKTL